MIQVKRITVSMKLLLIIFVLVISIMSISIISAVKSDSKELNEIDSALNYGSSSKLSSSGDTIFLPGTNLSLLEKPLIHQ
ncbi:MAG: hypothetical protein ACTSP4_11445 [Candidatus Hodarchaeales archaeon]